MGIVLVLDVQGEEVHCATPASQSDFETLAAASTTGFLAVTSTEGDQMLVNLDRVRSVSDLP